MTLEETFVEIAASYIGCPYIWQGKGDQIWTPQGLVKNTFPNKLVFDCSGLITFALDKLNRISNLGLPNMIGTHSSRTIFDTFPITKTYECGTLLLYPKHVAIDLGRGFVLDASGGDETTTSPIEALRRGASVKIHFNRRKPETLLGIRTIPLDKSALRAV